MTFADTLKFYRHELGLTWAEFSRLLDVSQQTVIDWTNAKSVPLAVAQEGTIARLEAQRCQKAAK